MINTIRVLSFKKLNKKLIHKVLFRNDLLSKNLDITECVFNN